MKIFSIITFLMIAVVNPGQNKAKQRIQNFLQDVKNQNISLFSVIENHLVQEDRYTNEHKELLSLIVQSIRDRVKNGEYVVYSKEERPVFFSTVISDAPPNEQFVLMTDNDVKSYLLSNESTMKAISTINKGGRDYFILIN